MDKIRIIGGRPLQGTISIGGAKNAALPLMAASLLTSDTLSLSNLPHLADITTMLHLLSELGVQVNMSGDAPNGGHVGRVFELKGYEEKNGPRRPSGKPIQEILVVLIGLINANQRKLLRIEIRRYWSLEVGRLDLP